MDTIVTCGCGDTDQFVKDAFPLLFKGRPLPPISHTTDHLEGDSAKQIAQALNKAKEKFAYYFHDEEIWDLLKGVRVQ